MWNRLVSVLSLWLQPFKSYDPFSRVMPEERKMAIGNIQLQTARGVAGLTLMVGHTFYNTTYLLLYLMACWFICAFIYGCFKKCKVRVAITKLV